MFGSPVVTHPVCDLDLHQRIREARKDSVARLCVATAGATSSVAIARSRWTARSSVRPARTSATRSGSDAQSTVRCPATS